MIIINIFYAINDAYVEQLCVSMVSVLQNNKNENIHFFILSSDITELSKNRIENLQWAYENWDIKYIVPDKNIFSDFKLNIEYISVETYFRYIIADLVPYLNKCLYLDADLVCNGSLTELWNTNIENYYCAGVRDLYIEKINYKNKIDLTYEDLYINAGVLLINLSKMRQDKMVQKLLINTQNLSEKILFQDQDIINITFRGNLKEIDSLWNFTSTNVEEEKNKVKNAIIIHYTGKKKPWHENCKHKLRSIWKKYSFIHSFSFVRINI